MADMLVQIGDVLNTRMDKSLEMDLNGLVELLQIGTSPKTIKIILK